MKTIAHIAVQRWTVNTMRDNLIKILQDMGRVAFNINEKADYLLQHDVVPVVRCKDCKHLIFSDFYGECSKYVKVVLPNDYCSYGERRTE